MENLIFVILPDFFPIYDLIQKVQLIESIYYHFYWWDLMFFWFLSNQGNIYMICHIKNLFYYISKTINGLNQIWSQYLLLMFPIQPNLMFRKKRLKMFFWFALIIMSLLSLFECITLWSLEDIKLIAIVNWIFHASDFSLRIFTISCKRGLKLHPGILQVIVFSFYHHFFRIWYNCCFSSEC